MSTNSNKAICSYPWTQNYQGSRYERKFCCISDDLQGLDKTNEKDFFNSAYMKQARLDMLAGKKRPECHQCYKNEENNIASLREESTLDREGNIQRHIQKLIDATAEDGSVTNKPSFYDCRTIHCNLQCVSCGIVYSSQHIDLFKDMFSDEAYDHVSNFKVDKKHEDTSTQEIVEGLKEKRIHNFYWAGGEPFMSPTHWTVMETMLELRKDPTYTNYIDSIRTHYNSNMTRREWKRKPVSQILNKFKNLRIEASLDGTHETLEYTRDGAEWNTIESNWREFQEAGISMEVASVLTAPVIFDVERYIDFFEQWPGMRIANHLYMINQEDPLKQTSLDICWYPDHIFKPAMDKAVSLFEKSSFVNKEKTIDILNYYYKAKEKYRDMFNDPTTLSRVKARTLYRDKFQKTIKLPDLLAITNPVACEWFNNLEYDWNDWTGYELDYVKNRIHVREI